MNQHAILFAGQETTAIQRDGTTHLVRIRIVPVRHLLTLIDLFDLGREADLLERCMEVCAGEQWSAAPAAFVDALTDESTAALTALVEELNFARAIATAERQIARGQVLRPLKERITAQLMAPLRHELESSISSLTRQLSSAAPAKKS